MNKQIDIKSFIIGILVTICIALIMGAGQVFPSSNKGRFQLDVSNNHAYVIDSTNGKVWEKYTSDSGGDTSPDFARNKLQDDSTD